MSVPIALQPGTLQSTCYPADPQTLNEEIINLAHAEADVTYTPLIVSDTAPGVDQRDYGWLNTNDGRVYRYDPTYAAWTSPHPIAPGGDLRVLWVGSEASLDTYDGGSAGAVGLASGPFWTVDHNFDARFPLAPGTLPSTAVVNVTNTGGEEKHVLTTAELAKHQHPIDVNWDSDGGENIAPCEQGYTSICSGEIDGTLFHGDMLTCTNTKAAADVGSDTAHNNMPPYYGVFFIKRTARQFWTA